MPGLSLLHVYGAGLTVYQLIVLAMLWHQNFSTDCSADVQYVTVCRLIGSSMFWHRR